jgi:ABC-2 type transport system permease protein
VATGIDHALNNDLSQSLRYLVLTFANALFLSWLAVIIVSRWFDGALNRAATGRGSGCRLAAPASRGFAGMIFAYLPLPLRLVAAKDLRTFLRDPMQWSQLLILFALLGLYLTNMPTLRTQLGDRGGWSLVIPFLNLCTLSLILATFTCRFVFPLVSLEGQKLWMIGLLPTKRSRILLAKFAFAMTVTLAGAIVAMLVAAVILELDLIWTIIHLVVTIAICVALCGCAVGIGARIPMFHERKLARIANGLGGTINLLASLDVVALVLTTMGFATLRSRDLRVGEVPDLITLALCVVAAGVGVGGGVIAMRIGAAHFDRVEI